MRAVVVDGSCHSRRGRACVLLCVWGCIVAADALTVALCRSEGWGSCRGCAGARVACSSSLRVTSWASAEQLGHRQAQTTMQAMTVTLMLASFIGIA